MLTAAAAAAAAHREPWLALKVLPSGFVGTSPWSTDDDAPVKPKALSTGM
jgi:hypothetical protein